MNHKTGFYALKRARRGDRTEGVRAACPPLAELRRTEPSDEARDEELRPAWDAYNYGAPVSLSRERFNVMQSVAGRAKKFPQSGECALREQIFLF